MAAAPVTGDVSDTDCSVCHDAFKEPKILPCGHVVCHPCLLSWLRAQSKSGCPLCRCAVLEKGGQPGSLEEEVGALPTDLALVELVEARALLDKDHTCCVCDDVAATALCLHCGDMMCASCTKVHRKLSMSKHHKVEDLSSLTPDLLAASRPSPCSSHPEQAYTLFCPTHGMSVCVLCAAARHRSCPDLRDLGEKAEEARAALAAMAVSLTGTETELKEAIQQLDRHIKDTEERVKAAIIHIQKTCDRLVSGVDSCRDRMSDLARGAGFDIQKRAQAAITILQARKSKATAHTVVVTRAEGSKVDVTVCEMSAVMGSRVQTLDCGVTLPASDALTTLSFSIDEGVVSTVEKDLAQLGQVHLVHTAQHPAVRQAVGFTFHDKHGNGIALSADRLTVTRTGGWDTGLVVSREPLVANALYEVRLDEWETGAGLAVGVLTVSPDSIFDMTEVKTHRLRPVTAVSLAGITLDGAKGWHRDHPLRSAMKELGKGDRVGVSMDTSNRLYLHVNGEDRGELGTAGTGPCYAFVDLWLGYLTQVTALPPTPLEGSRTQVTAVLPTPLEGSGDEDDSDWSLFSLY